MPKRLRWKTAHCNVTSYSASPRKRVQQKKHYSQTRQCSQFVGKKFPAFTRDQEVHDEAPSDHAAGVSYKSRLTKEKEAWKTLRQDLTRVFQEEAAPMTFHCQTCKEQCSNVIVCSDCHGLTHFCELCVEKAHENIMFHHGKQWKDTYFTPYKIGLKRTWSTGCLCSDPYTKQLTVVDFRGQLNTILFQFCSCEPECCSLLRFGLWGMSPTDPKVAIDVNLLKLLSALQLECHISTKGFWNTLQSLNMELIEEKKKYYRLLISESMHEFRAFQWKLKTLEDIVPTADKGTTCPACPVGEGTAVISIDANFGLVRKKKKDGIYELSDMNHYFLDQSEVDTFVSSYADGKNERDDANCSNFHAGNKVRSKASSKRLDVTGVFGASCRHEIPLLFLDMRHGERLAYPVFLLKEILHKYNGVNLFLMYDIACLLSSHLKKTKQTEVLSSMSLAVPVFHAYGHKASCQVLYNPRRVPGIGLSDGEVMERLWSYLRSFSKVTKEMTVSHRHDLLSHALLHFSAQKCQNIGASTVVRLKKANSVYSDASQQLSNLQAEASTLHLITEEKEILKWIDEEKKVHQTKASRAYKTTWKEDYVKDLKAMHAIRSTFQQLDDVDNMVEYTKKVHQLNLKLLEVERKHHIAERWTASSQLFQTVEKEIEDRERLSLICRLHMVLQLSTTILSI